MKDRSLVNERSELVSKGKSSLKIERNSLFQLAYYAINELVMTVEGKEVAKTKLRELWEVEKKFKSGEPKGSNSDLI